MSKTIYVSQVTELQTKSELFLDIAANSRL